MVTTLTLTTEELNKLDWTTLLGPNFPAPISRWLNTHQYSGFHEWLSGYTYLEIPGPSYLEGKLTKDMDSAFDNLLNAIPNELVYFDIACIDNECTQKLTLVFKGEISELSETRVRRELDELFMETGGSYTHILKAEDFTSIDIIYSC